MALEGNVDFLSLLIIIHCLSFYFSLNLHSVFEDHSSVSDTCEYQIERSHTNMSE